MERLEKMETLVHQISLKVFYVILFIYWCLIALLDPDKAIVKYSTEYWLYVFPISILLVVFFANFVFNYKKYFSEFFFSKNNWSRLFVLWISVTALVIIYNKDWSALRIIIPWAIIVSSLVVIKLPFRLNYLNIFFALSILSSIVGYHLGLTQYGYFLGQSKWNCFSLSRVSLYPSLFDSAFISFVVLTFNIFYNKSKIRYLIFFLSTYYMIFSASRTIYLCLGILLIFLIMKKIFKERFIMAFGGLTLIVFTSLVLIVMNPNALIKSQIIGNLPSLDKYVFHKAADPSCAKVSESGKITESGTSEEPYYHIYGRGELFSEMFFEFKQSPLLGTGRIFTNKDSNLPDHAGGPESFIAGLMVRFGISSLFFIFSFLFLAHYHYQKRAYAEFVLSITALVSWFLFGASASIYNFNFLLTISLLLSANSRREVENSKS